MRHDLGKRKRMCLADFLPHRAVNVWTLKQNILWMFLEILYAEMGACSVTAAFFHSFQLGHWESQPRGGWGKKPGILRCEMHTGPADQCQRCVPYCRASSSSRGPGTWGSVLSGRWNRGRCGSWCRGSWTASAWSSAPPGGSSQTECRCSPQWVCSCGYTQRRFQAWIFVLEYINICHPEQPTAWKCWVFIQSLLWAAWIHLVWIIWRDCIFATLESLFRGSYIHTPTSVINHLSIIWLITDGSCAFPMLCFPNPTTRLSECHFRFHVVKTNTCWQICRLVERNQSYNKGTYCYLWKKKNILWFLHEIKQGLTDTKTHQFGTVKMKIL